MNRERNHLGTRCRKSSIDRPIDNIRQRTIYFIAQHLALVVPRSEVVSNMHQAYQRLRFDDNAFGCFVSGPSKTADIEQSLVIGAHGARSLTVFLVD